ncbi:MAG TPA: efflux RND transporter periplasmic adaptor subunit [Gemmataceae bacterium]|nr:efflux RND transporter periplasmic adaptor subunit [Gemmataceae bacterium]
MSLLIIFGCGRSPTPAPQAADGGHAVPSVQIVKPKRAIIHREVSQPGAIEAFEETPIFAKIAGYVRKWNVDIGDPVRKDQILAELSVPELEVELEQKNSLIQLAGEQVEQAWKAAAAAEAALKSAEAQIKEADAGQERAVADHKRTKSQSDRLARAGQSGVIDKESVEENRLGFEAARASLSQAEARVLTARALRDESKAKWDKILADVRVAKANGEVARKNHEYVKAQLQYTRLLAPYDGVVSTRNINTGDFIQSMASKERKPLYIVQRIDRMRIFVQVPETDAHWVQTGIAARIRVQALPNRTFTGPVTRISWSLDPTARTLRAEIDLPNPGGRLRPGMYAYATLTADLPAAWTLPRSAVVTEGDVTRGYQTYCYQVEDGKARRLLIERGTGDSERIEVLKKQTRANGPWEPFTGTEEIVKANVSQVRDGQVVRRDEGGE